ncbi:MAG: aminopeptidase [Geminicoccaceae bacterium]|nr:aminopeptidase [Geminicoccaceae bacterium]
MKRQVPLRAPIRDLLDDVGIGDQIYALAAEIFPICRSITGNGVRRTLAHLARHLPLEVHEVPTGTQVFDWSIPPEWTIRDAYIKDAAGHRIVDFRRSNLHVLNYSRPVHAKLTLEELKEHVFTLPEQPDLIPYRTSYYAERWGFCMAHNQLAALPDGVYEVLIDASLEHGSLTYGEYLHRGETEEELLFSAHVCHPSLANDNCSGLALLTQLAARLARLRTRYSYRFVFAPGTIGAIAWLARNEHQVARIRHGLVVSCVGDGGGPTYKKSRRGDAFIDRAMAHVLQHAAPSPTILDFFPYGYDERQYCSPGFDLPVGLFQRSQFGTFPEYHTSADNLDFIRPEHLASSYRMIAALIEVVEHDWRPRSTSPKCEAQLGRRGLYPALGGDREGAAKNMASLWILNLSDGRHSLLDIAERAKLPFGVVADTARLLEESGLLVDGGRDVQPMASLAAVC